MGCPQEAVVHTDRVNVITRDRVRRIVGDWDGALAGASACARNVERSDGAMLSAQEAMKHVGCVNIVSRDVPRRVQVLRGRALAGACARAETSNVVNVPSVARTNP